MLIYYILAWIPMVFIAIINGIIRESTYGKSFSELRAHQISTVTGILLFSLYIGILASSWGFASGGQALAVGLIWLVLTIVFEFIFGHYVTGDTWSQLLTDYNLLAGRLWLVFLVWIVIAPSFFYYMLR